MSRLRSRWLTERLDALSPGAQAAFATFAAFGTYFCMYAFRKPFSVTRFEGDAFLGSTVTLKTALVLGQLVGYTISKYLGVRICPAIARERRLVTLVGLLGIAWAALGLFAILPGDFRALAMFVNGLPLGMVWGVVLAYLEGRRASEFMMAGLSCSFIVASGVVKDAGQAILRAGATEAQMPFLTGLVFAPLFLLFAYLLDHSPEPDAADVEERAARSAMDARDRRAFFRRFLPGLILLSVVYFALTALRDFRDNYGAEMLVELGRGDASGDFSRMEVPAGLAVIVVFGALSSVRNNRRGLLALFGIMGAGMLTVGASALLFRAGQLSGLDWLIWTGVGAYLAYVPFASMLFERVMATTRAVGTAVFAAQLADAVGYTGSVGISLYKDLGHAGAMRSTFFADFCLVTGFIGALLLAVAYAYFAAKSQRPDVA